MSDRTYSVPCVGMPARIHSGFFREGHVQGIAIDRAARCVYYSLTTVLLKTDYAGNPLGSVKGIVGHLGCITFDPVRRRVYGSLELKHDAIGQGIMARTGKALAEEDAFYCVSFDGDRMDRMEMDAEADGIMKALYLPAVARDYAATDEVSGARHRYGCSGIDGTALGPVPGAGGDSPHKLMIAYGIYSDTARTDNDHQVILQYDPATVEALGAPLSQVAPHHIGAEAEATYFVYTGNTTYGVQNLEYDPTTETYLACVYPGAKPAFVNHPLFFIDARKAPVAKALSGRGGEVGLVLSPARPHPSVDVRGGHSFPYGSTGVCALGDGLYAFSHDESRMETDGTRAFGTTVVLYRYGTSDVFEM